MLCSKEISTLWDVMLLINSVVETALTFLSHCPVVDDCHITALCFILYVHNRITVIHKKPISYWRTERKNKEYKLYDYLVTTVKLKERAVV